jgi:segregation and condensation protein B
LLTALLFLHADPIPLDKLARWLGLDEPQLGSELERAVRALKPTGLEIKYLEGGVALATAVDLDAPLREVTEIARTEPESLSHAAWETLAVVAYKQPLTRMEVEAHRQAGSERSLARLQERGLIEEVGRKETPGRPILYGTTAYFLRQFGLSRIEDLPPMSNTPGDPG